MCSEHGTKVSQTTAAAILAVSLVCFECAALSRRETPMAATAFKAKDRRSRREHLTKAILNCSARGSHDGGEHWRP